MVCLEKSTGREVWRRKLRRSTITNVVKDDSLIFAYAHGHVYGLDAKTGLGVWENGMSGLGYGYCIFAGAAETLCSS